MPPLELVQAEIRRRSTERERERVERDADQIRERCKTLRGFIAESWHVLEPTTPYVHGWHHDAISEHLEAITRGEILRLQINEPPGSMKSLVASVMWGAWEWGPAGRPGLLFLTTSYQETYARRDARKMRDLVQSEWYQALWPHIVLVRDSEADYENSFKGGRRAMPFVSLTSGRGNRVIIDDPHSTEQVESDADREKAVRVFRESVPSRVNDPKRDAILVIMHRLHPEDVCGEIESHGLPYVKLVLPMEYVRSTTIVTSWKAADGSDRGWHDPRTRDGDLLHPEFISRPVIERTKLELGPHAYDTQYQQMPRARAGSYFFSLEQLLVPHANGEGTTYEPVDYPGRCDAVFAVVDTASKKGKERDGTGVMYGAYTRYPAPQLVILDWDVAQIEAILLTSWLPNVFSHLEDLARACNARAGSMGAWVEDKDSGVVLLQHAAREEWPAKPIATELTNVGKDGRAISVSGYVNKGFVRLSRFAHDKTSIYKGRARNHLVYQVTGYRMGVGTPTDEDEMFDCFCYATAIAFGNAEGF